MAIDAFDLPKTIFSRFSAWILTGVLVAIVAHHGFGVIPRSPMHWAIGGVLVTNVLSAIVAENKVLAIFGDYPRFLGLGFLADMAVLYLAAAVALRTGRDWAIVAGVALAAFAITVAHAGAQAAGLDPIRWTDNFHSRPFSTLGNPDLYGHVISVFIGASLGLLITRASGWWRLAAVACLALAFGCSVVVATRGTLLGLATAVAATLVVILFRGGTATATMRLLAATGAFALIAAGILAMSPLGARGVATLSGGGTADRLALYRVAVEAWRHRPVLGFGVDNFAPAFVSHRGPEHLNALPADQRLTSAHSWPLQTAVTTGTLGLAVLVSAIALEMVALFRALPASPAVASALLVGSAAYWAHAAVSVGAIGVDWFAWVAWAAAASLNGPARRPLPEARGHARPAALLLASAVAVVASSLAVLTAVPSFAASREAWGVRDKVAARQGLDAISSARTMARLEPLRADHWNWLGLAYDVHGRSQAAAEAFARASRLAPHEILYGVNEARALARQGLDLNSAEMLARSRELLALARRRDPHDPLTYQVEAELEFALGRSASALDFALTAYRLEGRPAHVTVLRRIAVATPDDTTLLSTLVNTVEVRETASLHMLIAEVALRDGVRATARRHAARALELAPQSDDARRLLELSSQ